MPATDQLRVLLAPMNMADQPMSLMRALRKRGVYARQLQYTASGRHPLNYTLDMVGQLSTADFNAHLQLLEGLLEDGFNIYHFWQRSLAFGSKIEGLTGIDLPIIKAHGATVFHRFTGFDLRLPQADKALNPYSPYHHGYVSPFDEPNQQAYIDMLREYVDQFFVQDPEMHQFFPEARILPRGLDLDHWQAIGIAPTDEPLIVHAPSNAVVKGSDYVCRALEELRAEGLRFRFKLLERLPHDEAVGWYRKADIIVDQILIGATGVLTLEAWALAKPCVTYLREDLFKPFYDTGELPIANANPDTVKDVLRKLVKDYEWRRELSRGGRKLVEKFHDIDHIAAEYERICAPFINEKPPVNRSTRDLAFMRPRIEQLIAPVLPRAGLAQRVADSNTRLGRFEAALYDIEVRLMQYFLSTQALVFRGLLSLWSRFAASLNRPDSER